MPVILLLVYSCQSEFVEDVSLEPLYNHDVYLSLPKDEIKSIKRFGNQNFILAESRFYGSLQVKNGRIEQPLSKNELNISDELYAYFQEEILDINQMIDEGKYCARQTNNGYVLITKDSEQLFNPPLLLTRSVEGYEDDDYSPLDFDNDNGTEEYEDLMAKMMSDHCSGGFGYLEDYVNMGSYTPEAHHTYHEEEVDIIINNHQASYCVYVFYLQSANDGIDHPEYHTICTAVCRSYHSSGCTGGEIIFRNPKGETLIRYTTDSDDVYYHLSSIYNGHE